MITPDIAALEKWKSKSKDKRENVLNVLKNLESNVNGFYLHHNNVSEEARFEKIIEKGIKLRRERLDEL